MASEDRESRVQASNPEACPVVESLDIVGEDWRLKVTHALRDGEKRFNELKRETNARSRTLSQILEALTEAGLVAPRSEEADPIAVYYSLTEKGGDLQPVFDELEVWADKWLETSRE